MKQHGWWLPLPKLRLTLRNVEKVMCAVLSVAAFGNIFIVKSSFEVKHLQWILAVISTFVCIFLVRRVFDKTSVSVFEIYVSLFSAGLWVAQIVEVSTNPALSNWAKTRGGFIALSLALLSAFLYYMQRIVRETRLEAFIPDVS